MKQVYMAQNPIEAHMVVDLLETEGIEAIVQGEHIFAVRGALSYAALAGTSSSLLTPGNTADGSDCGTSYSS